MKSGTNNLHQKHDATLKLLMYRSMLASDKAWLLGFEAAKANAKLEDNPYAVDEEEYKCWENGWWEGFYGEEYSAAELSDELEAWLISSKSKNAAKPGPAAIQPTVEDKEIKINTKRVMYLIAVVLLVSLGFNLYQNI